MAEDTLFETSGDELLVSVYTHLTRGHEAVLAELVCEQVGQLSKRDQLLYTDPFDTIVNTFNTRAGLSLSAHDAWRIIAKLAK